MKIGIIGLGVVGGAVKHGLERIGHTVKGYDIKYPETRLSDVIDTELVFLCVPTHALPDGSCDTSIVESTVKELSGINYAGIVVIKSTVVPGTTERMSRQYTNLRIAFCPEFLRERAAFTDFVENHDLCVIGTYGQASYNLIKEAHGSLPKKVVQLTPTEAEFTKYFSNVYNALRIIFANEFYDVCKAYGVDYSRVKNVMVFRDTIADAYLDCNENFRGFGGTCLPKDTKAFAQLVKQHGLDLKLFDLIVDENKKFRTTIPQFMRQEQAAPSPVPSYFHTLTESRANETVLITGSEGNIGTYLVKYLEEKYPQLKIIRVKLRQSVDEPEKTGNLYVGDLQDKQFVQKIFQENKIDYVIHMAARLYGVAGFNKDIHGLFNNDLECLLHVLDQSQKIKKFVYMSSSMVYESSEQVPFTEELTDVIMPPKSSYGLTKYLGEKAVKFFHQQYGVPYTLWRPFNAVSPLESHTRDGGHVFVDFYRKIFVERQPNIEIYGNGNQVRCFTWVEDLVSGIGDGLLDPRTDNEVFNIGSSEPKSMFQLKDTLVRIGKAKGYLPESYNPGTVTGISSHVIDIKLRIPSVDKIKRVLGWECQTHFETCFEKFIDFKQTHS